MTRLRTDHIARIPFNRRDHAARLHALCGLTLRDVAAESLGVSADVLEQCRGLSVAVIPVSSGEGRIAGFDLALKAIAEDLGFRAAITAPDAEGLREAAAMDIRLWADDDLFVAHHQRSGVVGENGEATGRGFATVLHAMLGHNSGRPVLVRGCGPVGTAAARRLAALGHPLFVCDRLAERAERLARHLRENVDSASAVAVTPESLRSVLARHGLQTIPALLDAAPLPPAPGELPVDGETRVAAPGVPCLWTTHMPALEVWHDPLETGTAVMLAAAALGLPCGWSGPAPSFLKQQCHMPHLNILPLAAETA